MAELRVLSVREIELTGRAAQQWGPRAYESEILLITGRTHQVSSMRLTLLEQMLCVVLAAAGRRGKAVLLSQTLLLLNACADSCPAVTRGLPAAGR